MFVYFTKVIKKNSDQFSLQYYSITNILSPLIK